jgi:3-hydroxybutyryl-CoA dehydratase
MKVGSKHIVTICVTRDDVRRFADLSGDHNPIHSDDAVAQAAGFPRAISHGMFLGALVSKVLGVEFPGNGTIYLHQSLDFREPVLVDSSIRLELEVVSTKPEKGILRLSTTFSRAEDGRILAEGIAIVKNTRSFQ